MKRLLTVVFAGVLVGLVGWAVAQPPGPGDEPPVRLKKKEKLDKPDPKKPDPEKPDPMAEKPKKKPRLDDDLDPRDDPKLPPPVVTESNEREIMQRLARNTRLSEEKLGNRELGEGTR